MTASSLAGRIVLGALLGLFGIVCLGALAVFAVQIYVSTGVKTISADLAFHLACPEPDSPILDQQTETFLRGRGFAVLDKVRAAHSLGKPSLLPRDILAADARSREIQLVQIPFGGRSISMTLRTPPPTQRDDELEASLISFAQSTLGCRVHQITRGSNGPERRAFHDDLMKINARLLRTAAAHQTNP